MVGSQAPVSLYEMMEEWEWEPQSHSFSIQIFHHVSLYGEMSMCTYIEREWENVILEYASWIELSTHKVDNVKQ